MASRECDNPRYFNRNISQIFKVQNINSREKKMHFRPENEGAFCVGERIRYKVCNLQACPENEPSFRAQQCSKFNNETYREKKYEWLPYFDNRE